MEQSIIQALAGQFGERIRFEEPLARYTTFKIGGPAELFYEAKNSGEFVSCLSLAWKLKIPVFVLGGGTNILIGDKGIRGLVIKNSANTITLRGAKGSTLQGHVVRKAYVECDAGVIMNRLVRFTVDEGLAGFEMHLGLPGTVGGALYMNSKWMHPEGYVGDRVHSAEIMRPGGVVETVQRDYFRFGYDTSILQQTHDVVIRVIFELDVDSKERLWKIANDSIMYRRESQPQGILSAGCTFQNISKEESQKAHVPDGMTSAGYLIDKAGLKGHVAGGAQISPIHANFIANTGRATASDVLQLIELARRAVQEKFGVTLQEEIVRVGDF